MICLYFIFCSTPGQDITNNLYPGVVNDRQYILQICTVQHYYVICNRNVSTNFLPYSHTINPNNETCLVTCAVPLTCATWHMYAQFFLWSNPQPGYKYVCTYVYVCIYVYAYICMYVQYCCMIYVLFTNRCCMYIRTYVRTVNSHQSTTSSLSHNFPLPIYVVYKY